MQSGPEKGLLDELSSWLKKITDADPRMEKIIWKKRDG